MRFVSVFTVACLLSGVFVSHPISVTMAVPAPKTIKENNEETDKKTSRRLEEITEPANKTRESTQISPANAETQKEKLVQSKEITDPANEKKESAQTLPVEKPKASHASTVDYGKIIGQQIDDFPKHDLAKNLAALPLKPIATIAISNLPDGLKKAFFVGDKIYSGFSMLAQLFVGGYLGGIDCPGVDPNAPCYVLLFPHASEIILPLVCFKATPESLIVKNLQSEANKAGDWQLISPTTITEKAYNIRMAAPKSLFSKLKDFSTVTALFDPTKERVRNLLSVELDVESLGAFMPLAVLKLAYDTYIKGDFDKITLALDIEENELRVSLRYGARPKTPWAIYGKSLNESVKSHHILNFPSEKTVLQMFSFCDYTALETLFSALSTRAKPLEWERDPIAHQLYQWAQVIYPVIAECLRFQREFSTGNGQRYDILGDGESKSVTYYFEEMKPSLTDNRLCSFLEDLSKICRQQFASAVCKNLPGSEIFDGGCCFDKGSLVHKLIFGSNDAKHSGILTLYCSLYRGHLLWATSLEGLKQSVTRMKNVQTFSYIQNQKQNYDVRLQLDAFNDFGIEFPKDAVVRISSEVEVNPEVFVTTIRVPWSAIETVCDLFSGSASSEEPDTKDASEVGQETEKTTKNDATGPLVQSSDVSKPTDKFKGDNNASNPAIPAKPAAVR